MWAANAWPEKSFTRQKQREALCDCPGSCKKQNVSRKCMTGKKLYKTAARWGIVCLPGPILQSEGAGVGGNVQVTGRPRPTWTNFRFYAQRIWIRLLGQIGSGYRPFHDQKWPTSWKWLPCSRKSPLVFQKQRPVVLLKISVFRIRTRMSRIQNTAF